MKFEEVKINQIIRINFGSNSFTGRKFGDYTIVGINTYPKQEVNLLPIEKNMYLALWYDWDENFKLIKNEV